MVFNTRSVQCMFPHPNTHIEVEIKTAQSPCGILQVAGIDFGIQSLSTTKGGATSVLDLTPTSTLRLWPGKDELAQPTHFTTVLHPHHRQSKAKMKVIKSYLTIIHVLILTPVIGSFCLLISKN